jgi:hypothetical protein
MAAPDMAARRAGAAPGLAGKLARLLRDPFTVAGLTIYAVLIIVAVFADQLMTHDPGEILFRANGRVASNQPPSAAYLLGTTLAYLALVELAKWRFFRAHAGR